MEVYLSILTFTYNFIKYDNKFLQNTTKSKNMNCFAFFDDVMSLSELSTRELHLIQIM